MKKNLNKYDVIHLHSWRNFQDIIVHRYAKEYGVPYIVQAHGSLPRVDRLQRLKWLYDTCLGSRLLRDCSRTVALTRTEIQHYKLKGVPGEKIALIPNGLELSEYVDLPPRGDFKGRYNIDKDTKIILYLGRIHRIKGIDILVKAYAKLVNGMNFNDVLLVIAGPDDGYLYEVRSLISQLRLQNKMLLTGPLYARDKLEAYVDAEVYVLPSRYETFPHTILEAFACRKPVIVSDVESMSDIVDHMRTGLLFESENVQQLVERIKYILTCPDEGRKMGIEGHLLLRERFSIERVSGLTEALYRKVLEEKNSEYKLLRGMEAEPTTLQPPRFS